MPVVFRLSSVHFLYALVSKILLALTQNLGVIVTKSREKLKIQKIFLCKGLTGSQVQFWCQYEQNIAGIETEIGN